MLGFFSCFCEDPGLRHYRNHYPLHYSIVTNSKKSLLTSLPYENVNLLDPSGQTALEKALLHREYDMLEMLLDDERSDLTTKNSYGNTLLIVAIERNVPEPVFKKILSHSLDCIDIGNAKKFTPLAIACKKKNMFMVNSLIELGADVNGKRKRGAPLGMAIHHNWIDGVRRLLRDKSLDLEHTPKRNRQGFLWTNNIEIIKLLLQREDINVSLRDKFGMTADDWLRSQNLHDHAYLIESIRKHTINHVKRQPRVQSMTNHGSQGPSIVPTPTPFEVRNPNMGRHRNDAAVPVMIKGTPPEDDGDFNDLEMMAAFDEVFGDPKADDSNNNLGSGRPLESVRLDPIVEDYFDTTPRNFADEENYRQKMIRIGRRTLDSQSPRSDDLKVRPRRVKQRADSVVRKFSISISSPKNELATRHPSV